MKTILMTAIVAAFFSKIVYAQDDSDILNTDPIYASTQSYMGDTINIDAQRRNKPVLADRELQVLKGELVKQKKSIKLNKAKAKNYKELAKTTEKLADSTETMAQEKSESQKLIEEYNAKISCLEKYNFDTSKCRNLGKRQFNDSIQLQAAAPQRIVAPKIHAQDENVDSNKKIKATIGGGMKNYTNVDFVDGTSESFESDLALGVKIEAKVHERIAIGGAFQYSNMSVTKQSNYFYSQYSSSNNTGRTMTYNNLGVDLYGKFFVIIDSMFKPYIATSLGVSKSKLDFDDRSGSQSISTAYGPRPYTGYSATNLNGGIALGMDFDFNHTIGLSLETRFSKNFTSSNEEEAFGGYDDQFYIDSLGQSIDQSAIIDLGFGLTVSI